MTTSTWITMIVMMAFVWGGFALALRTAIRKESGKGGDV
ncbi:MAG: MetS family NSS transporter small subunit [Gemmatimonadota bacterium]|nr:MetS family NSS transporter small subunit [Gemmatimonadota bacterium]MDH5758501.1 MetS family NSS transporter small subunit [Gemmatimonadota bacterium]